MAESTSNPDRKLDMALVRERFDRAMEQEADNRTSALKAIRFRNLEQWESTIKNARETDPEGARPCLVLDKTNQFLRQVCNDERQNRPSIKVRPVDGDGDQDVAKVLQGIVRHIEDKSGADLAYDTSYEQAVDGGFGYFRLRTEYCDEKSFEQDIIIERIRNRFQVVLDPDRQQPDGSDSQYGFIFDKMPRSEYEKQYPDADALDFDTDGKVYQDWVFKDYVIVAEYFHIERKQKDICLWESGEVTLKGNDPRTYLPGDKIVKERKATLSVVEWDKVNAKESLEHRELPGRYIPIVEVVGNELDIEGKRITSGLIKPAMDAQCMYNYAGSNYVEMVALAPRAPWIAAEDQIAGSEQNWRSANRRNISVLTYRPVLLDGGVQVPAPQRNPMPGIPAGWQQAMGNFEHDISASMGMYSQNTLGLGDAQSGKQELLQQKRGDTATFHYQDNLARSLRHCGRILLEWIPVYYDTERVARIIGDDGTPDMAKLNPNQPAAVVEQQNPQTGAIEKIYNLNVGKYDVTVSTGPGFLTKRAEAAEFMSQMSMAAKDPVTSQVLTYLAVRNNDWSGASEAAEMLKKLLPPGIAEDPKKEQGPMVQTPEGPIPVEMAGQAIAGLMQKVQQQGEALQKADTVKTTTQAAAEVNRNKELELKDKEIGIKGREVDIKAMEAEERLIMARKAEADGFVKAQADGEAATAEKQQGKEALMQIGTMINDGNTQTQEALKLLVQAIQEMGQQVVQAIEDNAVTNAEPVIDESGSMQGVRVTRANGRQHQASIGSGAGMN